MTGTEKNKLLATLQGGRLVLDLGKAKKPGGASLDVNALRFAHFHTIGASEGVTLGYSDEKGGFTALADFARAGDAEAVRDQITTALLSRGRSLRCLKKAAIIFVIIIVAFWILNWLLGAILMTSMPYGSYANFGNNAGAVAPAPAEAPGMPTDADHLLKPAEE